MASQELPTDDFRISPKYYRSDWEALSFQIEEHWRKAITIVEDRIKGRLVTWIDEIESKPYSGFVVVALDCMLLETLHGFQSGSSTYNTREPYLTILSKPRFGFSPETIDSFCEGIRNGMIHDTETRGKWLIAMNEPEGKIVCGNATAGYTLNRRLLHDTIKAEFADWIGKLRLGDQPQRERMRKRMDQVVAKHFET